MPLRHRGARDPGAISFTVGCCQPPFADDCSWPMAGPREGPPPGGSSRADTHLCRAGASAPALAQSLQDSFAELDAVGVCAVMGGCQRNTFGVSLPVRLGASRTLMGMNCGKADVVADLLAERERIAPALKDTAAALQALLDRSDGHI